MIEKSKWFKEIYNTEEYKTITAFYRVIVIDDALFFLYHAGVSVLDIKKLMHNFIENKMKGD
jgi:acid phosphatase family membrane protein YuiD